jgi:hypothetical protein
MALRCVVPTCAQAALPTIGRLDFTARGHAPLVTTVANGWIFKPFAANGWHLAASLLTER